MRVDQFDFQLPDELIALRPATPRESARLLTVSTDGGLADRTVDDLPSLLEPGDVLVFNDTKVIPAQLEGRRIGRGTEEPSVGVTLHQRLDGATWKAFVRGARKLQPGDTVRFGNEGSVCLLGTLDAVVQEKGEAGEVTFAFAFHGAALDEAIATVGSIPLPPYIATRRPVDDDDRRDYQTIYSREAGAVAAPTAGLHFTPSLMERLAERGVVTEFLTLHVGAGTFLPMKADDTQDHRMHAETGHIDAATAARLTEAKRAGRRIVAVGTTSLRLLESAAADDGSIAPFSGSTEIFITPGYRFKAVDRLMTNFHLPRSTLFMLVSAFSGLETMQAAYAHAIAGNYRFYSYGDACLLDRTGT
ncbi:tRNA preQ1(34) S-adenosylmethionine ribosyltransferase-isomerase QueA [Aurantimonas aggregata]|uniref:S-adenosylmethionine:tRNA ribosyltransferase-isomerase n=1 Tax=Aurantimonas aggregata TaxID=2047720 RepID=A0A6L9MKN0_9HYPH|nr:tRNA preQ1(34) S-adenosylmethionine ribosyltransferase-isomerase QueA [Aurantimonas aggregata]NDV88186.1 tRNA preQ1(34) S-adenosylmethionine ribosyltransferase-isomerase QueA [Aurantimonas aggregata]